MDRIYLDRLIIFISSILGILLILFGGIKTPENFRIISDLVQNFLLLNIIVIIFMPNKKSIKISIFIGIFVLILDFLIETIAVYLNWWYPLGGIQFPPILVIPLEMVLSFFIIGVSFTILLTYPEKIRKMDFKFLNWIKFLFNNPKLDILWQILLVFINALIGMMGDYSVGSQIWRPGPHWIPFYTFLVWLIGGFITLLLYKFLNSKIKK